MKKVNGYINVNTPFVRRSATSTEDGHQVLDESVHSTVSLRSTDPATDVLAGQPLWCTILPPV